MKEALMYIYIIISFLTFIKIWAFEWISFLRKYSERRNELYFLTLTEYLIFIIIMIMFSIIPIYNLWLLIPSAAEINFIKNNKWE